MEIFQMLTLLFFVFFLRRASASPSISQFTGNVGRGQMYNVLINRDIPSPPSSSTVLKRLELHDDNVRHIFDNDAFSGFSATLQRHHVTSLKRMPDVSVVERDGRMYFANSWDEADTLDMGLEVEMSENLTAKRSAQPVRTDTTWGLQMISTGEPICGNPREAEFNYYIHTPSLGSGADIYILDTGVYTQNKQFGGRATSESIFLRKTKVFHDHGTAVAGVAGASRFGVASNANLIGVKLANDNETGVEVNNFLAGIQLVAKSHEQRRSQQEDFCGSVINISLHAKGNYWSIRTALQGAINAGIHVVVAAGNDARDACCCSPANLGGAASSIITVGGVNIDGFRYYRTNYGPCVDLYAPAKDIISLGNSGPMANVTYSGTSFAAPFVSGMVANVLGLFPSPREDKVQARNIFKGKGKGKGKTNTKTKGKGKVQGPPGPAQMKSYLLSHAKVIEGTDVAFL